MVDEARISEAVASILHAIGDDPDRDALQDTPDRVARLYGDLFSGIGKDPKDLLQPDFDEDYRDIVLLKGAHFFSVCEHHLLPFSGTADIGYVPNGRVVGIGKLARALDALARRPQLQERLTAQLADAIDAALEPAGVVVVLRAEHLCLAIRGASKPGSVMVTSASRGVLRTDPATIDRFNALLEAG